MLRELIPALLLPSPKKNVFLHTHNGISSYQTAGYKYSAPLLPPELIESIIDEVGLSNDRRTLKSCSLVSSAFVFRSQLHLFKHIDLDKRFPRKRCYERFYKLLAKNPHLGVHVRYLRLGDDSDEEYGGGTGLGGNGSGRPNSWIIHSKTLPHFLSLLPQLHSFSLTFNSEWTSWKSIPTKTCHALERLFTESATLKSVSLEFITEFPLSLVVGNRGLLSRVQRLWLSCVDIEVGSTGVQQGDAHFQGYESPIKSLFLRGTPASTIDAISQGLVAFPLSNGSKPALQKLSLTPTFENGFAGAVSDLLKHNGESIQEFEWLPSIHFCSSVGSINIATLPNLRSLKFIVSFRKTHAHGPFPEVIRLLNQISSNTHTSGVETITFECHCLHSGMDNKSLRSEWRPIDKMLAKPAFSKLKEVKVILPTSTSAFKYIQNFLLAFQDALPLVQQLHGVRIDTGGGTRKDDVAISVHTRTVVDERFGLWTADDDM